jgi:hypothetical protein
MKRFVFYVIFIALATLFMSCPSTLFKTPLPDELLGSWSNSFGSSSFRYTATWTFRKYDYTFSETAPAMGVYDESYTTEIVEVDLSENMFISADEEYGFWHISGNTLYFIKTNPGADKPTLESDWWEGMTGYTKQ